MNRVLLIGNNRFTASIIAQVRGLDALTVIIATHAMEAAQRMQEAMPDVVIAHAECLIETNVVKTFGEVSQNVFFIVLEEPDQWSQGTGPRQPRPLANGHSASSASSASTLDVLSEAYIEQKIAALEGGADVYMWLLLQTESRLSTEATESVEIEAPLIASRADTLKSGLASGTMMAEQSSLAETIPGLPNSDGGRSDTPTHPPMRLRTSQCRLIQTYIHVAINRAQRYHDLSRINDWLSAVALIDALTQLSNRRAFDLELPQQLQVSRKKSTPISLMVLDIDYFKSVNDRYGHLVGDDVLKQLAKRLLANMRFYDTPFRYGGEEFVIILNNTELTEAQTIAERLRHSIGSRPFELAHLLKEPIVLNITISIGLTELQANDDEQGRSFLNRADQYLLKAKATGRNQVVSH